jgi:hypothetical protein
LTSKPWLEDNRILETFSSKIKRCAVLELVSCYSVNVAISIGFKLLLKVYPVCPLNQFTLGISITRIEKYKSMEHQPSQIE